MNLYKEMVNPEEKRKYREFKAQKRTRKQKEFVGSILKRCDPFMSKIRESIRKVDSDEIYSRKLTNADDDGIAQQTGNKDLGENEPF